MTSSELDDLIKRYRKGSCTSAEEQMIEEFFNAYQSAGDAWEENALTDGAEIEKRIYSRIVKKIDLPPKRTVVYLQWLYRSAAAVLIFFSFFYVFTNTPVKPKVNETPEPLVVKTIKRGQKSMLHLKDGTVIFVNSGTKVSYPGKFANDKREIFLDGEAFFEVSHNENKPFIVHTGALDIKVLGTSFNINTFDDKITVTLKSGKVYIQNINPEIHYSSLGILNPNQQLVYEKADNSIRVNEVDVTPYIAWTKKQLIFREEPLYTVVKKLEKWYDVEITLENNQIKDCIFTGTFDNEPLRLVLESLHNVANINYTLEGNKVKLSGSGCPENTSDVQ